MEYARYGHWYVYEDWVSFMGKTPKIPKGFLLKCPDAGMNHIGAFSHM